MRQITGHELGTPLTAPSEALELVLSMTQRTGIEVVETTAGLGRALARDVTSPMDVAPFDSSSMDGWAVDTATAANGLVQSRGTIATGAPLPAGADGVVPWEEGTEKDGFIVVERPPSSGQFVRPAGQDLKAGELLARSGDLVGPVAMGVLASVGITSVEVHKTPLVAVLVTGDEVVAPGDALGAGQVYDVHSSLLPALLQRSGAEVTAVRRAGDDLAVTEELLCRSAAEADVVVTTGGASVGQKDWARAAIENNGEVLVWRVAMKPGKPFAAGMVDGTPVLSLPGNPGSVLACFHAFVAPLIRAMRGVSPLPLTVEATACDALVNDGEREHLVPARLDGGRVTLLTAHSSQGLSHARTANALVRVAPGASVSAGDVLTVELTD